MSQAPHRPDLEEPVVQPLRLVLASASPARLSTLDSAGFAPTVHVSRVDEDQVLLDLAQAEGCPEAAVRLDGEGDEAGPVVIPAEAIDPRTQVLALARAKAIDVAVRLGDVRALVLGCDSMLEVTNAEGRRVVVGKPGTPERATQRWREMSGASAVLHTGHWLVHLAGPARRDMPIEAGPPSAGATSSATVHFAQVSEEEIAAYVATGEPLQVAGAFTIDGLGAQFVTGIEGDPHGIVGVSVPLVRTLAADLDLRLCDLWRTTSPDPTPIQN